MSGEPCPHSPPCGGFTLIEVIAALLIFVMGVLMVLRLSAAMTNQLEFSGIVSELVVIAHEQVDSLAATPFDSLEARTVAEILKVGKQEIEYTRTVTVSSVNSLLYQFDVDVLLKDTLAWGPSYSVTTYSAGAW